MTVLKNFLGAAALAFSLLSMGGPAQAAKIGEMVAMQAAMQQFIGSSLVKGSLLQIDMKTGKIRRLYPLKAHPLIFSLGDYFVLCSDFRDEANKIVNVDYYLARENGQYVVFHTAIEDRRALMQWISEGRAKRLN